MPPTTEIKLGPARVAQIEGILKADDILKNEMGPKDAEVPRRDGTGNITFHRLSYAVASLMMAEGKEPMTASRDDVKNTARSVLEEQGSPVAQDPAPAPAPAPAPVAAAATPAAAAAAPAAAAAAAPAAAAPAAVDPASPIKKKRGRRSNAEIAAAKAAEAAAAGTAPPAAAPASVTTVAAPVAAAAAEGEDELQINVPLAVYSLIVSAQEIALRDKKPGTEDRQAALGKVAKAYRAAAID